MCLPRTAERSHVCVRGAAMIPDQVTALLGVKTAAGQRMAQVRVMTSESSGQVFQVQELWVIRANGDWIEVGQADATQTIRWLIGDD